MKEMTIYIVKQSENFVSTTENTGYAVADIFFTLDSAQLAGDLIQKEKIKVPDHWEIKPTGLPRITHQIEDKEGNTVTFLVEYDREDNATHVCSITDTTYPPEYPPKVAQHFFIKE